ncbi:MAG: hypothetical protein QM496_13940 [Verrucomicrobiota bacterium]
MNKSKLKTKKSLLRGVSIWSVSMLQEMDCASLFDGVADGELSAREKSRQLAALIWVHHKSRSEDEIEDLAASGKWQEAVKSFHRDPQMIDALPEVDGIIERAAELLGQATDVTDEAGPTEG